MTTFQPRPPYSHEELARLYPSQLSLQLVQIIARHGERTPVSARFQNAGLSSHWPYCNAARYLTEAVMNESGTFDHITFRRRLETFSSADDAPVLTRGPKGEIDNICDAGELTDKGRQTTLALGQRLRHLYINQLAFMPMTLADADSIYLRATPIPRALQSILQVFWGMYPTRNRTPDFKPPTVITRMMADEDLFPNEGNCQRLRMLAKAFANRSAERWNQTDDMDHVNKMVGKWMPDPTKRIGVDSHPRLSGIMDTINSTSAHGLETRLPPEFYDSRVGEVIDKVGVEEWFSGFAESQEYRRLGVGSIVADTVSRMVGHVRGNGQDGLLEVGGSDASPGQGRGGEKQIKLGLSGAHDVTLAAYLTSLGAFEGEIRKWPPYTSHLAIELFRQKPGTSGSLPASPPGLSIAIKPSSAPEQSSQSAFSQWFSRIFNLSPSPSPSGTQAGSASSTLRTPLSAYAPEQSQALNGYYVRIRYNDVPVKIPACRSAGKHLEGDDGFCTLAAFKQLADSFTPKQWKEECRENLERKGVPPLELVDGVRGLGEGRAGG